MVVDVNQEANDNRNGAAAAGSSTEGGKNGRFGFLPFGKKASANGARPEEPVQPKLPPDLAMAMGISHVKDEQIHRMDGKSIAVFEVQGMNLEPHVIHGFAAMLNSINNPFQILIRQHAPALRQFRVGVIERTIGNLPGDAAEEAALSFDRYLEALEGGGEIIDRHFYIATDVSNVAEMESGDECNQTCAIHVLEGMT